MKAKIFCASLLALAMGGCSGILDEEVFSQLDPGTLFNSSTGVERVLFGAYDYSQINGNFGGNIHFQEEWTCDQFWETGGAVNQQFVPMHNFTFDASYPTHWNQLWNRFYKSVRNCNLVLENLDGSPIADDIKARMEAEARFIRASVYFKAQSLWGGVPLRTSTTDPADMARATAEEVGEFVEREMLAVAEVLPNPGEISGYQYGRATKGAAMAYLCKYYLNSKQWQKCADMAKKIMDLDIYELWPDYTTLFTVENEQVNKEFIWVYTCSAIGTGNEEMCGAFPASFHSTVDGKIVFTDNMRNWARMDRVYDSFYDSFDPADKRLGLFVTEYINTAGKVVSLLNNDNIRSFKYTPDPNAVGNANGNDIPVIRYADILLSRAEALNELLGPNQETLDLLQMVRDRAGLTDKLSVSSFTKETLRDRILDERSWEFYQENLRRQDLIRHGKFISSAKARIGDRVDDHFLVFPIPQNEIDANKLCEQNPGY